MIHRDSADRDFLKGLTVLYVEDEDFILEQGSELLARYCGRLITAKNGEEGLAAYQNHHPDIIVTDIRMPIMDGLEMVAHIREHDHTVAIIVLTAFDQVSYLKQSIELGIERYITKPINLRQFTKSLLDCARRLRTERQLAESERKFRIMMDSLPVSCALNSADGTILYVNANFEKTFGYVLADIPTVDVWMEKAYPDDEYRRWVQNIWSEDVSTARANESSVIEREYRVIGKNGSEIFALIAATDQGDGTSLVTLVDITRIKRLEQERQRRSEEQRIILENAGNGMIFVQNRRIKWANSAFNVMFGYNENEVIGASTRILYPTAEEFEQFGITVYPLLTTGEPFVNELRLQCKNDTVLIISLTGSAVNPNDPTAGSIWSFSDITTRKALEDKLQKSHKLLHDLSSQVPGMIFQYRISPEGLHSFPFVSYGIRDIFELAPEDIGENATAVFSLFHPDDAEGIRLSFKGSALTLSPWEYEYRVILPQKGLQWHYGSALPQRTEDGSTLWHGFTYNITDRKNLEYQLSAAVQAADSAQKVTKQLLETTDQGIYGIDASGACTFINRAGLRLLGHNLADCLGYDMHTLVHHSRLDGTTYPVEDCPIYHAKNSAIGCRVDTEVFWRSDGTSFLTEYSSHPIIENDSTTGAVVTFSDITERRRAEQTIRELELFNRSALNGLSAHICVVDVAGDIIFTNLAWDLFAALNGATPESIGKGINYLHACDIDRGNPENSSDLNEFHSGLQDVLAGELQTFTKEYPCHSATEDRWFICHINQFTIDSQKLAVISHENITERKLAEMALVQANLVVKHSNDTLNAIVETMSDWVWEVDSQWRYTFCSDRAVKHLGYTSEEIIGKTPLDFMPPEEAVRIGSLFVGIVQNQERIINLENWNRHKDGQPILLKTNGVPIFDAAGILTGYRGVDTDITKLREYEDELRKLSRIVEQSPVSIIMTDPWGIIEFVNPKFTEITGYTPEELVGQNPRILQSGLTPPEIFTELWTTLGAGGFWHGEMVNRRKDGSLYWELATITPLRNSAGLITHYVAVCVDVTEKKMLIDELNLARERAELATKAKSNFLSTMSHEIRTPMNGVIGMADILLESGLTVEQRDYAEIVRKSGENLLEILNEILDFSKIEAGKLSLEIIAFDLLTTMEDTAELLALRAVEKQLELICTVDPAIPKNLTGDSGRVRQIITNLAGNAIKFTQAGEIVLRATLNTLTNESVTVLFEVSDTGIGIPEDRLDDIFTPFTQAESSTTRKYGGTGLGLTICRQLAELMGGEIGVTSEYGSGSTFWFTVCFDLSAQVVAETGEPHASGFCTTSVLIVDDNYTSRVQLTKLLEGWGCLCQASSSAEMGLQMLHEAARSGTPFSMVLIDHQLPGCDGVELGRQIKADPHLALTAMVLLTTLGRRLDTQRIEQAGFVATTTKPLKQDQLHECLSRALGRQDAIPAGQAESGESAPVSAQTWKILLAEDNLINQKVAHKMISSLGYNADVVANGIEALRALEKIEYDMVLMDCQMPEMNGFMATIAIRDPQSCVLNHKVPIIAMTANAMSEDREECLKAGMDDYLSKPVNKSKLSEMLTKWLAATA